MRLNLASFLVLLIFLLILNLFSIKNGIFKYLDLQKEYTVKAQELKLLEVKERHIKMTIKAIEENDLDLIEELLKVRFDMKRKEESVYILK